MCHPVGPAARPPTSSDDVGEEEVEGGAGGEGQAARRHRGRRRRRPPGHRAGGGQSALETIQGVPGEGVINIWVNPLPRIMKLPQLSSILNLNV